MFSFLLSLGLTRLYRHLARRFGILTAIGTIATTILRNDWYAVLASLAVVVSLIVSRLFGHAEMRLIRQRLLATWNSLGNQIPDS